MRAAAPGSSVADNENIVAKPDDLKKKYASAATLRTKKVDEIRELLAIPPDPNDEEAVEFIAQWLETGQVSVRAELKAKAQRLLREWQSIHMTCVEIQCELDRLGEAGQPLSLVKKQR